MLGALGAAFPVPGLASAFGMAEAGLAYKGQKDANESNERIAKENRTFQREMVNQAQDFEQEMSSTAYQRSMSDMKSAGLNPILAYQQGGASTPIGKTAPGSTAQMQNPFGGMGGSPVQNMSTAADVNLKGQQTDTLYWEARKHATQSGLNQAQADKVAEEIQKVAEEIEQVRANTTGIEADNVQRQILADFYESAEFARIAKSLGITPAALGGIFRTFFLKGKKR